MHIDKIHPELRATYARIPAFPIHNPVVYFVAETLQKLFPRKPKPFPGVSVEERSLGQAGVRIYRSEKSSCGAAALWIHGGGYILGDVSINDRECSHLANELGLVVVSVEYRLAPKHPFPAALDDCFAAWQFMLSNAHEWRVDPQRMAVIGQSAGGGLAAGLAQRVADTGLVQPAAQVLMYPMLDDRTAANRDLDNAKNRLWNNNNNRGAWSWYLGQPAGLPSVPLYAAPGRQQDLSKLPPAWLGVGELDLFYQENLEYARRLQQAGVSCELHITPQAPHAFDLLAPEASVSQDFLQHYFRFLRDRLSL